MRPEPTNEIAPEAETVRALREELARLAERVAALEAELRAHAAAVAAARDAGPPEEELDEALVAVIGAAVAAYLGKKPRIRSIRVLSSPEWARQGRMHIQASHALAQR